VIQGSRVEAYIPVTCKYLDEEDKSCEVYGEPERPELCSRFPASPYDILQTGLEEVCTYVWKQEHEREESEEKGGEAE
jgi:Fe-S-cluster containining protein